MMKHALNLLGCQAVKCIPSRNKSWLSCFSLPNIYPRSNLLSVFKYSSNFTNNSSSNLAGVYPPIATPFDHDGNISYEKLKFNVTLWDKIPFRGYVVLGSTGEFVSLSEDEQISSVKFIKENVPSDKLVIAGTGCESTRETVELTNKMADAGAHFALIVSPHFYKGRLSDDLLYIHYTKVADSSKIPVILYSVPANTNIDLSPSLVARLAVHPNIIGLKDSGGDITKIGLIVHQTRNKDFQVLAGSAGFFYTALCIGCVGGIMALANPLGSPLCKLHQLFLNGQHNEACDLQHKLIGPNLAVTKRFGIPGVKAAMDMLEYYGGPPRLPLKKLESAEEKALRDEFRNSGFL